MSLSRKPSALVLASVVTLSSSMAGSPEGLFDQLFYNRIVLTPLHATPQPPNKAPLTAQQQLGKDIFFDPTLSNPVGYACASCHSPQTGFTGPNSAVNILAGPVSGVIAGRVGKRKPQAIPYAAFSPTGPSFNPDVGVFVGGNFWDGRATDTATQAQMPFLDQDEMANTPAGPFPPHTGGYSPLVAKKLGNRPYTALLKQTFGGDVLTRNTGQQLYVLATQLIAAYEASAEVVPFSSKWDASVNGISAHPTYIFTASEERGRVLFFGPAQCFQCHNSSNLTDVTAAVNGRQTFTMYCYANIGVPRNLDNPFYFEVNAKLNPLGYNPLGQAYVDYGLGSNPNPGTDGTVFMNSTPGDIAMFRGLFKAPSVRNVDQRPNPTFIKAYMHNGVFKSLKEVVHFYNKRNIAVDAAGHEVVFDLRVGPPPGTRRLFDPPEVVDNAQNAAGVTPDNAGEEVDNNGQVGHLGLSDGDEDDLVAFLQTLTDGYPGP
jgi:cytochrome c peroxidase